MKVKETEDFSKHYLPMPRPTPAPPGGHQGSGGASWWGQVTPWSPGSKQTGLSVSGELRFPFPPDNVSRKNRKHGTEREPCGNPGWLGGGVRFSESDRGHNRGVNELHFHILLCRLIRILIWPQPQRERIGPTWLPGLARAGGGCNLNTVLMIRPRPCSRYLTWIPELFIPMIQITSSHLTCRMSQSEMISLSLEF